MKYAKIVVLFVAMIFVAGQTVAGDRRATFDQLAKGIRPLTDAEPYLVISKSDVIRDVGSFFGSRRIAERFEQILQDPEGQKDLINDILYLVYGKLNGDTISKIGQSAAIKFNAVAKNWKAVNETCRTEGCSQDLFDLINLSGPDNWKPSVNITGPENWKPSLNGDPAPSPAPQK